MSEIIDPETLASATRVSAGESDFYVVDHTALLAPLLNRDKQANLFIDDASYSGNTENLISSTLKISRKTTADQTSVWKYQGDIQFNKSALGNRETFARSLVEQLKDTDDYDVENFYFNNAWLMVRENIGLYASVGIYMSGSGPNGSVEYSNQFESSATNKRPVSIKLTAPSIEKIGTDGYEKHFWGHIQAYGFVLNALSKAINDGRPAFRHSVVTKDGIQYAKATRTNSEQPIPVDSPNKQNQPLAEQVVRGISLDDIGGLEQQKTELKKVIYSHTHPEIMEKYKVARPQSVFLYGPPGTGKTTIAEALANGIGAEFKEVGASNIYGKWIGDSERNIDELFDKAEKWSKPTVWFWDEFDGIINNTKKTGAPSDTRINVAVRFRKRLDRLKTVNPNVLVLAAAETIEDVEESILRRFDSKILIEKPNDDARAQIFSIKIAEFMDVTTENGFNPFADDIDMPALVRATVDMTGADITKIVKNACFEKAMSEASGARESKITQADLINQIRVLRQS